MSIFEDRDWTKEDILEVFGSRHNLCNVYSSSYFTSNGEILYKDQYYYYIELQELLRILDLSEFD